jgi:hypothetical protein
MKCKFISMLDSSGTYTDYMLHKSDGELCTFSAYRKYRPTKMMAPFHSQLAEKWLEFKTNLKTFLQV